MENTKDTKVPGVKLGHLKKMINNLEQMCDNETDISFEYILASCFPTCWNNIQKALSEQYTQGYIQGTKDAEEI